MHEIVVVGGGASGLELVTKLGDGLGRRRQARVTLVERTRMHVWKPLLHAVAAGSLNPGDHELNYLAQAHWHHFNYRYGALTGLDRAARKLHVAATHDEEGRLVTPERSLPYDTLIIAIGSVTNDFGTPGTAEFAVPLETLEQARRFNRRLINACIRAQTQDGPVRPGQLHVAVIGAGATGTELAADLHRTVREMVSYGLDKVNPESDIRIVLIEAAERVLPALPVGVSSKVHELLTGLGVEVQVGARVTEVTAEGVALAGGAFIPAELVVWAAGVKAPEVLGRLDGLEVNRINQLLVQPTLQTTLDPDVFAIGDCASCPLPGGKGFVPPRAQAAHQQASHLARQMERRLAGQPLEPYRYRDFGSLVTLGKHETVGSLMGGLGGRKLFVEGLIARVMYLSLYKGHEKALHGITRAALGSFGRRPGPAVKLH
jgi:NADH dehydrogenase